MVTVHAEALRRARPRRVHACAARPRRVRAGSVRALVALALAVVVLTPTAAVADSPRCAIAAALIDEAQPRAAADLVDKVRASTTDSAACEAEAIEAAAAIQSAATHLRLAREALDDERWQDAKRMAGQALAADATLTAAGAIIDSADDELTEETGAEFLASRAAAWTAWLKDTGKHLGTIVSGWFLVAAVIVLAARVLLLFAWPDRVQRWTRGPWARSPLVAGLALLGISLYVSQRLPALLEAPLARAGMSVWLPLTLTLVAVLLVAAWLYQRQRVIIQCFSGGDDAKSDTAAADIVTHLRQLGASAPRGLELPIGADVAELKASNITEGRLPTWIGGLISLIQDALSVTPWRVRVDSGDKDVTTVIVSRHGRTVDSTRIQHRPLTKDGPVIDPDLLVAAFVLLVLSRAYGGFRGLGGATSWESVGLQYAGAREPDPAKKLQLLAKACDLDIGNLTAQYSLRMEKYRNSTDPGDLERASRWMQRLAGELSSSDPHDTSWQPLAARAIYASMVFDRNRYAASGGDPAQLAPGILDLKRELARLLDAIEESAPQLHAQLAEANQILSISPPVTTDKVLLARTPRASYTLACTAARGGDTALALRLLDIAYANPRQKTWARQDPELSGLVRTAEYRRRFPETPPEFLTSRPLAPYSTGLSDGGWDSPRALSTAVASKVAAALGTTTENARDLIGWGRLAAGLPSDLSDLSAVIVDACVSAGLPPSGPPPPSLANDLVKTCQRKGYDLDTDALERWLRTESGA